MYEDIGSEPKIDKLCVAGLLSLHSCEQWRAILPSLRDVVYLVK